MMGHVIMSSCQQQQNILTTQHVTRRSFIPDSRHTYSYVRTYVHTVVLGINTGDTDGMISTYSHTVARTHSRMHGVCMYITWIANGCTITVRNTVLTMMGRTPTATNTRTSYGRTNNQRQPSLSLCVLVCLCPVHLTPVHCGHKSDDSGRQDYNAPYSLLSNKQSIYSGVYTLINTTTKLIRQCGMYRTICTYWCCEYVRVGLLCKIHIHCTV